MSKKSKKNIENKTVRSVNKNIRSSNKKLNPILRSIVGKKVDIAIRDLTFSDKRITNEMNTTFKISPKSHLQKLLERTTDLVFELAPSASSSQTPNFS